MERKYPFCLIVNLFQSTKKLFEPLHLLDQGFPTWGTRPPSRRLSRGTPGFEKMDRNCNICHKNGNFECVFLLKSEICVLSCIYQ